MNVLEKLRPENSKRGERFREMFRLCCWAASVRGVYANEKSNRRSRRAYRKTDRESGCENSVGRFHVGGRCVNRRVTRVEVCEAKSRGTVHRTMGADVSRVGLVQ